MDKKTASLLILSGGLLALFTVPIVIAKKGHSPNPAITRWDDYILTTAFQLNLNPALIAALIEIESSGYKDAAGTAGEIGLCQIKCETAKMMGFKGDCKNLYQPDNNIFWGAKYLRWQYDRYNGNLTNTFSAYNAGKATDANKAYVNKALTTYQKYRGYYG